MTAVESWGVKPTNQAEETSSLSLVAVPVLPAAGRSSAERGRAGALLDDLLHGVGDVGVDVGVEARRC